MSPLVSVACVCARRAAVRSSWVESRQIQPTTLNRWHWHRPASALPKTSRTSLHDASLAGTMRTSSAEIGSTLGDTPESVDRRLVVRVVSDNSPRMPGADDPAAALVDGHRRGRLIAVEHQVARLQLVKAEPRGRRVLAGHRRRKADPDARVGGHDQSRVVEPGRAGGPEAVWAAELGDRVVGRS